jgi:predicted CXXCH cytochrome family protein
VIASRTACSSVYREASNVRRALLLSLLPAICVTPVQAWSQHPAGPADAAVAPEYSGCPMCHGSHGTTGGPYGLRTGRIPGVVTSPRVSASGASHVTQSCLRCHSTQSIRGAQPDFASLLSTTAGEQGYLGLDLSNDHPVGEAIERAGSLSQTGRPYGSDPNRLIPRSNIGANPSQIECTTCHDPHDRNGSTPRAEEQHFLCGSCHDLTRYSLAGHSTLACTACHKIHGGHDVELLAEPVADVLCNSCHGPGGALLSRATVGVAAVAPEGHRQPQSERCTACHAVHR